VVEPGPEGAKLLGRRGIRARHVDQVRLRIGIEGDLLDQFQDPLQTGRLEGWNRAADGADGRGKTALLGSSQGIVYSTHFLSVSG
jgi:hypothetical protein